jgi:PIN domain nuclease of toxin-antitoxin system
MVLLDTHVAIWLAERRALTDLARRSIDEAMQSEALLFSSASAWEIGILIKKGRVTLTLPAVDWIEHLATLPGIRFISLDARMAVEATCLPEPFHDDPADRFLLATARRLNVPIVTRDARILTYAQAGHVRAIAC